MRAIEDAVIITHVALATLLDRFESESEGYDSDPEDLEEHRPRVFVAQTGQCPLVSRAKALMERLLPPVPPLWIQILFAGWIVYCTVVRSVVLLFLFIGPESSRAAHDELTLHSI
jgi:hypothetical protein